MDTDGKFTDFDGYSFEELLEVARNEPFPMRRGLQIAIRRMSQYGNRIKIMTEGIIFGSNPVIKRGGREKVKASYSRL